jgi:hypothetical protein
MISHDDRLLSLVWGVPRISYLSQIHACETQGLAGEDATAVMRGLRTLTNMDGMRCGCSHCSLHSVDGA